LLHTLAAGIYAAKEGPMSVPLRTFVSLLVVCLLALFFLAPVSHAGDDWLPVTAEELKLTGEPKAPGAPAIYLYRQVDRDDREGREHHYARIKILTDEGRKYADVEIPFWKGHGDIKGIQARTIRPDGSIASFDGKVYEKMIVKAKGVKYLAKTFTLPDVQAGSVIEYRYTRNVEEGYIFDSQWLLSDELFTKHAKFSLRRSNLYALAWSWPRGLPEGTSPPHEDHDAIRLDTQDIPAFQIEDYMPPQDEMKYRVDFRYLYNLEKDSDKFWKEEAQRLYRGVDAFTNKRKAMEQAVGEVVAPTDTPEQKLQKIYARCQKIRNTSFERDKTQQELNRQKLQQIQNVEDVWKRGYGNGWDITWLFLALARAAGFDASPVLVSTRDQHFFNSRLMNAADLNTNVVLVKLNGTDLYLDPGVAFAPFGVLPWYETGVNGLRVDKDGGTWVTTTMPGPSDSGIERKATLQLDDSGTLEGKATLTFKGLSALWHRLDEYDEDDAARKKLLEDEIKNSIPVTVEVELTNAPDWSSSANTLVAEYHVKVPGWASAAGRRTLLSMGLFGGGEKHVFEHAARVHPVYFSHPYQDMDDVTIELPPGLQVSSVPNSRDIDVKACRYRTGAQNENGTLHLTRQLTVNIMMVDIKYYDPLRTFYQAVRTADEEQIVLSSNASSAQN
jgi:Domain of Unknown Function with PDB structure (DUF3857)/Transglutaminase-like superfamily